MKVALDVSAVPERVAGAGRYIVEIARRLPGIGIDTTLVARRGDASRWRQWSPNAAVTPVVPSMRAARLLYEGWTLGASAPARGADVWHGPHYTMPRRGSTPTVVTIHDLTYFTHPEWHERVKAVFFRRAIVYAAEHAKVLLSVSDTTTRLLDQYVPDHSPVVVAPHGVDLVAFTPEGADDEGIWEGSGMPSGVPYILFVGTVEPRKGLDVLLDAFADVASEDAHVELWLAGQSGWGLPDFAARLASHPWAARIHRLGYVDESLLPVLMRHAAVVVYPSRDEGFGLPVLEALACGAMVVTSADTVMAEVAGDAASLVAVGDVPALGMALSAALRLDGPTRAQRSQRSRARAELFTWDASLAQHRIAYERAVGAA